MSYPFVKMHGAGNDVIVLNGIHDLLPENLELFSKKICHRQFGIGADQVLIVLPSQKADFTMAIYNADGGQVEMCGNGIRCFAKYLLDKKLTTKTELCIETKAGIIKPRVIPDHPLQTNNTIWVCVDMGAPVLAAKDIPVNTREAHVIGASWSLEDQQGLLGTDPVTFDITTVSMGNPHCVIFVDDVQTFPVARIGSKIEKASFFPQRTNVEFVQVVTEEHVRQRTWERGAGETLACGTGASAVLVASVLNGLTKRKITVTLPGGDLELFWDEDTDHVYKTGPATTVFEGRIHYE